MRSDTEMNPHGKRIMAGAVMLTIGLLGVKAAVWVSKNHATAGRAALLFTLTAVACYALGTIGLAMAPGNDERGRP